MEKSILKYNFFGLNLLVLIGLFLIPCSLIFNLKLNVSSIGVLIIGSLWHFFKSYKSKTKKTFSKLDVLYLFSFYIIQVIGLLYSTDYVKGMKEIETKFAFLLFPLIFLFFLNPIKLSKRLLHLIILVFGICLLTVFYFYLIPYWVLYTDMQIKSLNALIPNELKHVYFGMFSVFSFFSFFLFFRNSNKILEKRFLFFCMVLLFLIPIILTARVATFLSLLFILIIIVFDKQNRLLFGSLLLLVTVMFSIWAINYPEKTKRFENILTQNEFYNPIYHRKNNIECAFNIFLENPLIGVGTGSVQPLLNVCYSKRKYWGLKHKYNSHNEYLAEMARHGIIGFFAITFLFFFPMYFAFNEKNYLYFAFLIIIITSSFTENIFSRQLGVVFFTFFNTLFYFSLNKKKNE